MTLEALENYKKEIMKAHSRIEEANRDSEAILARLENDLDAVREFAEEEAGSDQREQDISIAVKTAYRLGYDEGFKAGVNAHE